MTGPAPSSDFDPAEWAALARRGPRGWFRLDSLDDALDHRLDALLDRVLGASPADVASYDLVDDHDRQDAMLQTYAVRAAARAVRHRIPGLVLRAAAGLAVAAPVADHRDQLRSISVVGDAARRVRMPWSRVVAELARRWPEVRLRRFHEYSERSRHDRSLEVMGYRTDGRGPSFRYVDKLASSRSSADILELADRMEAAGLPADVVVELRDDAAQEAAQEAAAASDDR